MKTFIQSFIHGTLITTSTKETILLSSNSEVDTSELLKNLEEMSSCYSMDRHVISKSSTTK